MTRPAAVKLDLKGLRAASPQVLGAIRIVPLVRESVRNDLRLDPRAYDAIGIVSVDQHGPEESGLKYFAYIPHGLVVSYTSDGSPVASLGASLGAPKSEQGGRFVRLLHRMVKQEGVVEGTSRVRLLPLHLAMEGYLALHFRGPEILWREYSAQAGRFGLDPRVERSVRGTWLNGLEEAFRVFEIHPNQVGVLLYVAETLATAFVVPHPSDYRRLHRSIVEDFFGELLLQYATLYTATPSAWERLDARGARTLEELASAVEKVRASWQEYALLLASNLFERDSAVEVVRTMGPFTLERFLPDFDPSYDCHIGERIVRADGSLEYLKTFRLSAAQVRRAYLLVKLAEASWNIDDAASLLRTSRDDFMRRLTAAGFGFLLRRDIQEQMQREQARRI